MDTAVLLQNCAVFVQAVVRTLVVTNVSDLERLLTCTRLSLMDVANADVSVCGYALPSQSNPSSSATSGTSSSSATNGDPSSSPSSGNSNLASTHKHISGGKLAGAIVGGVLGGLLVRSVPYIVLR